MTTTIHTGDCRDVLRTLADQSVHCCVTSPPYFGLRDYGCADQMGLEATPAEFVDALVGVMREVRRVLRDDGTLWLNLGDSYANDTKWGGQTSGKHVSELRGNTGIGRRRQNTGLKSKDLIGIPWRVAFALQADGWYLRQDIIWAKPNPMPESVTDRCTKAHEYLFLLSKSPRYYYNADAIREPLLPSTEKRIAQNIARQAGSDRVPGKTNGPMKAVTRGMRNNDPATFGLTRGTTNQCCANEGGANKRSVWTVATRPYKGAHFATFPPQLIEPCILAGCPEGGTVLDPFAGTGTVGLVADWLNCNSVLIELNPANVAQIDARLATEARLQTPLFGRAQG